MGTTVLQNLFSTYGETALYLGLGGLAAAIGVREARRLMRAPVPIVERPQALPSLSIVPGTTISQIPAFQMRLTHECRQSEPDPVRLLDDILAMGYSLNASDIHLTPSATSGSVTFRVHGVLYDVGVIPSAVFAKLTSRIKVLAQLTIFVHATPQDGQFSFEGRHRCRVSILPTSHGERAVLRLASADYGIHQLNNIGLTPQMLADYTTLLNTNQGMFIVTGPTGSGKTTTMYASLLHLRQTRGDMLTIATLEDPVEFDFPGITQTQIEPEAGLTFALGLRSILRQDPDVILVGEIRDDETAENAIRAASTGHVLFSTIHADSAAAVFNRIIKMGVEPFQMASCVRAVISQRLCRRLCQVCKKQVDLSPEDIRQFQLLGVEQIPEGPFYKAVGCGECLHKGYNGRSPIYELLVVNESMRDIISEGRATHHIANAARQAGMASLMDDALARARRGEIPIDEALRVVSS